MVLDFLLGFGDAGSEGDGDGDGVREGERESEREREREGEEVSSSDTMSMVRFGVDLEDTNEGGAGDLVIVTVVALEGEWVWI